MTNFEMVEMLREKTNVSYEEAKAALEATNWDLLDAMVLLEKEGKVVTDSGGSYSTRTEQEHRERPRHGHQGARSTFRWIWTNFCKLVGIGNVNHLVVSHRDNEAFSMPVTAFVVLLICGFPFMICALIIGLFFGLRYSFRGPNLGKDSINDVIGRASDAADTVKSGFRNAVPKDEKQENDTGEEK